MPRAAPVTTATGLVTGARSLRAGHAVRPMTMGREPTAPGSQARSRAHRLAALAEVPGERRAAAADRSAERDADADVVEAAVEQDLAVSGRAQPRAHDR